MIGIIPIAGCETHHQFPNIPYLMPIAEHFTAIEKAIVDAVYAGCMQIWIIVGEEYIPLLKHRIPDWIYNPIKFKKHMFLDEYQMKIPIMYVKLEGAKSISRSSLVWTILRGFRAVARTSRKISSWAQPRKYYVGFPYGIIPQCFTKDYRKNISKFGVTIFRYDNKSFYDNEYLPFVLSRRMMIDLYREFEEKERIRLNTKEDYLPSAFKTLNFNINRYKKLIRFNKIDVDWYYDIRDWKGYKKYLSSKESDEIFRETKGRYTILPKPSDNNNSSQLRNLYSPWEYFG